MAGKKGGGVALQTEVNNEEDWEKLLEKEGLVVVDIYSEWCGPCLGMVGNLKKLKLEIGSDYLHLAVAKSDAVEVLSRFRNKSEPTWMFIGSGQMVHVMFGANAPNLMRTIQQELKKELKCMSGERERQGIPFNQMTEEEQRRAKVKAAEVEAARQREEQELADKLEELKIKSLTKLARKLPTHTLTLYFPHMIEGEKRTCTAALKMLHKYDAIQLMIIDQQEVLLTQEQVPELFYMSDIILPEKFVASITQRPCLVTLLLGMGSTSIDSQGSWSDILGKVEEKLGETIYGKISHNNPGDNTPAANHQTQVEDEIWPGIWTPLNYLSKASAVKILFPSVVRAIGHEDDQLPPPMYVIIFEASRAHEVSEVIAESPEVLKVGYFDSIDPEVAKKVCRNTKELDRMNPEKVKSTKMVMSLAKTSSDPLLAFSQLAPIYISPDLKTGTKEAELFFPPDEIIEEDEEMEEEFEEEEGEDEEEEEEEYEVGEEENEEDDITMKMAMTSGDLALTPEVTPTPSSVPPSEPTTASEGEVAGETEGEDTEEVEAQPEAEPIPEEADKAEEEPAEPAES